MVDGSGPLPGSWRFFVRTGGIRSPAVAGSFDAPANCPHGAVGVSQSPGFHGPFGTRRTPAARRLYHALFKRGPATLAMRSLVEAKCPAKISASETRSLSKKRYAALVLAQS